MGLAGVEGVSQRRPGRSGRILRGISQFTIEVPWLHNVVYRTGPVVEVSPGADRAEKPEPAVYDFNWLSTTGTSIFLAAVLSAFWLRISPRGLLERVRAARCSASAGRC